MWMGNVRLAERGDLPFLREMLYEAVLWRPGQDRPPIDELLSIPELSRILEGWGRQGDTALIAILDDQTPIGAIWYRFWTPEYHSFGFVDTETPEMGIAVRREFRNHGVGTRLLYDLIETARRSGIESISLSVEPDNPSLLLYEKFGFVKTGEYDGAWTMRAVLKDRE